ncbi:hypothetical protein FACS189496_2740 [Bacilli bacterium]|nr:hypothetical protein FACS189496_2740 [Bacilli bacterium]
MVNPTFRISHVVKLAKKYKFTPICVLTIEKPLLLNFEENYSFMKKLNPNTEVFRTYTKNTSPEELNKIFRSKYNVQAVVPYEDDLLFAEKLAKLLNVACNDFNSLNVRKDKYKFNELLAHNHVPSAKQMMVEKTTKTDDIIKYFNNTFPIVIKPIDGAASVSVYICKNKNDLTNAIQGNNVFKSKFVAQEFIDGDEYIVNFVTYKSKHYLTNISVYDRRVVDGHVIDFGHCAVVEQNKLFKDLEKYGKDVLNVSGVNCGTTHLEIKLSKRGPILIECN